MSIAWTRRRVFCAFAVFAVSVIDPGGTPAHALDAPATSAPATPAPAARSKVTAKTAPGKVQSQSKPLPQPPSAPPKNLAAHPAGWPTNATSEALRDHRYSPPPPAPEPQKPKTPPAQNAADPAADAPPEAEEQYFFQRMIRARTRIMGTEPVDAKRQERADMSDGARRTTQDPTKAKDDATKSSGFLSSISALWGGDAPAQTATSESTATPAKPPPAGSETNTLLSKIGAMMPGFLGGSDKK